MTLRMWLATICMFLIAYLIVWYAHQPAAPEQYGPPQQWAAEKPADKAKRDEQAERCRVAGGFPLWLTDGRERYTLHCVSEIKIDER